MATAEKIVNVDQLSKDERALVVASLTLKRASVLRAMKAETNQAVVEVRSKESAAIEALIGRFS